MYSLEDLDRLLHRKPSMLWQDMLRITRSFETNGYRLKVVFSLKIVSETVLEVKCIYWSWEVVLVNAISVIMPHMPLLTLNKARVVLVCGSGILIVKTWISDSEHCF